MLFLVRDRGPVRGGIVRQRWRAVREPVLYHPVYLVLNAVELRVHYRVDEILDVLHRHRRRHLPDVILDALVPDGGIDRKLCFYVKPLLFFVVFYERGAIFGANVCVAVTVKISVAFHMVVTI
jgi:hypothetical protein